MPSDDAMNKVGAARRMEIFTGSGRRRRWSSEDKARIVAESYAPGESVSAVARRYGLAHTQLFAWRRDARVEERVSASTFVPVLVEPTAEPIPVVPARRGKSVTRKARGAIELEINGVLVRVGRGAEAGTIATIIQALKSGG